MRWEIKPFSAVVDILDSRRVPVNSKERAKRPGDIPYYGATGQVGFIDTHIFDEELVLLGEDGAPFLDAAKPKAYLIHGKSWVNNHAHVLRGKPGLLNSFLLYQLNNLDYRPYVSGTTRLKLPQGSMKQIPLLIPPLDEQREIVAEIEKQFTRLEAGVGALKRVQANLKRYRAAVLKAACEGKLVPTEAELAKAEGGTYETGEQLLQRILTERRKNWTGRGKYKEPIAPDTSHLPELPWEWTWATVEQLGQIETGNTPPKAVSANYGNDIPFVKPPELLDRPVFSAADNLSKLGASIGTVAPIGAVLVSCIGNLGKTAIAAREVAFNQQINGIIPPLLESARWIFYAVQQGNFRRQLESVASATTIAIVNKGKFSTLSIPLPPLAEQKRIIEEVERRLSVIDEMEATVSANLQRSTRLRQSILQKGFSGEFIR